MRHDATPWPRRDAAAERRAIFARLRDEVADELADQARARRRRFLVGAFVVAQLVGAAAGLVVFLSSRGAE